MRYKKQAELCDSFLKLDSYNVLAVPTLNSQHDQNSQEQHRGSNPPRR